MILSREKLLALFQTHPQERRYALALFQDIQKECGYLPKAHIVDAAEYLNIPLSQAYAMVTFYRSLSLKPRGKYVIKVCDGTACHLRGSENVLTCLMGLLGIQRGGTDEEGLFTVEMVNCLGACALAPAMQIGDEFFGSLTDDKISEIITEMRKNEIGEARA